MVAVIIIFYKKGLVVFLKCVYTKERKVHNVLTAVNLLSPKCR